MSAWAEIIAVARREFTTIWTDSRLRTVVLFAPFLYAGLFCLVYSNHTVTKVPMGLVQGDPSAPARQLVRMLASSSKLDIKYRVQSVEELKDLILDGKIDAAVVIPSSFSRDLKRGHSTNVATFVNAASMVSANTAAKAMNEVIQTFSAGVELKTLMKKGDRLMDAKERFMPVRMQMRALFNPAFNYSNFMVPGLLAAILQQVILLGVALTWTGEKERGSLGELFKISRSPMVLLIGKSLPYLVVNFVVAEFFLRVLFPLNDIPMEGAWTVAIPFTVLFVITIVFWGIWVSGLCKTRLFATQFLMFLAMPSFVLSGFTWPRYAMPWIVQIMGDCLPLTYFVGSFRKIYLAGVSLEYIWQDFAALTIFASVNIALSYLMILRMRRSTENESDGAHAN